MKVIKSIGFDLPTDLDDYIELNSKSSLSECDIVILEPNMTSTTYSTSTGSFNDDGMYNGKLCYNHSSSTRMIEHSTHWQEEYKSFLKTGKTLIVILSGKSSFYIQTGQTQRSGTGKNQKITNIVTEFDNYKFLPNIKDNVIKEAHGDLIIAQNYLFKEFVSEFQEYLSYEAYLSENEKLEIGFTTKAKDKILGGVIPILKGNIIFLPKVDFEIEDFIEYDKNDKAQWNKKSKIIGKKFISSILAIDKAIRKSDERTPRPAWLKNDKYILPRAQKLQNEIELVTNKITDLKESLDNKSNKLVEAELLNDLLFETGKRLENAVTYALITLGYKAENFDDGDLELDQIITSPEGHRFIGECEGKDNKSIDVSKFRQLTDALSEDFEKEEIEEKAFGILFGNPFRLMDPTQRKNPFTKKCLNGAKREKIGLIETKELFDACKYLETTKNISYMKKCRSAIFKSLGETISIPKPPIKKTSA